MTATLTVITVTPDRAHLVLDNPDRYNVGKVMRADANGTRTVRTVLGQLPSTAATFDFYDYEYALAFDETVYGVRYLVYNTAGALIAEAVFSTGDARHMLTFACPLFPYNGIILAPADTDDTLAPGVSFAVSWSSTRAGMTRLHSVVGRADPVAVLRAAATRAGDITLICPDHRTCKQIESQLALPQVWMLRQSDVVGLDAYLVVTSLAASNVPDSRRWQLVVSCTEVAWPPGELQLTDVWWYQDVPVEYGDYNAVAAAFASYAALLDKAPSP